MDPETREFLQDQFGRIDERLEGFDHRFERVDQQFTALREDIDRRFENVEEEIRHTRILVEGLKSDLQAVAEGFDTVDAKIDRSQTTVRAEVEEDRKRNSQLHGRHERRITDLEHRVDLLESAGG